MTGISRQNSFVLLALPLAFFLWQNSSCHSSSSNVSNKSTMNSNGTTSNAPRDLRGQWGGQHISMEVTEEGASINYDCAHGRIVGQIIPDREGNFEVKGFHTPEHPGPTREGEDDEQPALYRGSIHDETMTLTVEIVQTKEVAGNFNLTHGSGGRIRKCM
jgi:hypothetical protein